MAWTADTQTPNPIPFSTHVINFENLNGANNKFIEIILKSNCTVVASVDISQLYAWLKVTGTGVNKSFQFFRGSGLNEPDYTSTPFKIVADAGKKTVFRFTNNQRGGLNTPKWIGSDNTRNDYGSSAGLEFRDIKNEYLGFLKDTSEAAHKLRVKWNISLISFTGYAYNTKSDCDAITLNNMGSTCLSVVCP